MIEKRPTKIINELSDTIIVRNMITGDTKSVKLSAPIKAGVPTGDINDYIRDPKVASKQKYTIIDPDMPNIFVHDKS